MDEKLAKLLRSGQLARWVKEGKELIEGVPRVERISRFGPPEELMVLLRDTKLSLTSIDDMPDLAEGSLLGKQPLVEALELSVYLLCGQDTDEMERLGQEERRQNLLAMKEDYDRNKEKCYWSGRIFVHEDTLRETGWSDTVGMYKVRYYGEKNEVEKERVRAHHLLHEMEKGLKKEGVRLEEIRTVAMDSAKPTADTKACELLRMTVQRVAIWSCTWKKRRFEHEKEARLIVVTDTLPKIKKGKKEEKEPDWRPTRKVHVASRPPEPKHRLEIQVNCGEANGTHGGGSERIPVHVELQRCNFYNLPDTADGRSGRTRWRRTIAALQQANGKSPLDERQITAKPIECSYPG